jgi:catechol 2,3-dioxygenase-like lactoylglutathione lyase family enzyme
MINGFHTLVYSDDPDATRAFLRDVLGWPFVDSGGGWLIFKTPPSEVGVHPSTGPDGEVWGATPLHRMSFMCDDLDATLADLAAKGVEVVEEVWEQEYGRGTSILIPGAGPVQLYQPFHQEAHALDG